mgnify:CR=1 FL=1
MDSLIQTMISVLLSIVPWLFPSLPWYIKLIVTFIIFLISLIVYCLKQSLRIKILEQQNKDIAEKHSALATRFDEKMKQEEKYHRAFSRLNIAFQIALASNQDDKLIPIYKSFLIEQETLNTGGSLNEDI